MNCLCTLKSFHISPVLSLVCNLWLILFPIVPLRFKYCQNWRFPLGNSSFFLFNDNSCNVARDKLNSYYTLVTAEYRNRAIYCRSDVISSLNDEVMKVLFNVRTNNYLLTVRKIRNYSLFLYSKSKTCIKKPLSCNLRVQTQKSKLYTQQCCRVNSDTNDLLSLSYIYGTFVTNLQEDRVPRWQKSDTLLCSEIKFKYD